MISRLKMPSSYQGKLFLIAFVGTHIPLLSLVIYVVLKSSGSLTQSLTLLMLTLLATLLGMSVTLAGLHLLLQPINASSEAMRQYLKNGILPDLPTTHEDQAGQLMADVQFLVCSFDTNFSKLKLTSSIDGMTGLFNRTTGEEKLAEEISRAARDNYEFLFCFLDINHFKKINDVHGHLIGDKVIAYVARVLSQNIRKGDWCARWGGDEFVLILFGSNSEQNSIFERLDSQLLNDPLIINNENEILVSICCGASKYRIGDTIDSLIKRSDDALYFAKKFKSKDKALVKVIFDTHEEV